MRSLRYVKFLYNSLNEGFIKRFAKILADRNIVAGGWEEISLLMAQESDLIQSLLEKTSDHMFGITCGIQEMKILVVSLQMQDIQ